jgi:hypothetical protein
MSRFLPPDHAKGDEGTIGGYAAVHARPAAFEGRDGYSYSVEILVDAAESGARAYGAFFLFLQWKRMGEQGVEGHLESEVLAFGPDRDAARSALGAMRVEEVQRLLDGMIESRIESERDAMRAAHDADDS